MVECYFWIRAAYKKDKRRLRTAYFLVRLAGLEPAAYGLEALKPSNLKTISECL